MRCDNCGRERKEEDLLGLVYQTRKWPNSTNFLPICTKCSTYQRTGNINAFLKTLYGNEKRRVYKVKL